MCVCVCTPHMLHMSSRYMYVYMYVCVCIHHTCYACHQGTCMLQLHVIKVHGRVCVCVYTPHMLHMSSRYTCTCTCMCMCVCVHRMCYTCHQGTCTCMCVCVHHTCYIRKGAHEQAAKKRPTAHNGLVYCTCTQPRPQASPDLNRSFGFYKAAIYMQVWGGLGTRLHVPRHTMTVLGRCGITFKLCNPVHMWICHLHRSQLVPR